MISRSAIAYFDSHCHLQDHRIAASLPQLFDTATRVGVKWFAVNGTSEDDWEQVKKMGEEHHSVIPCFGLHPWYLEARSKDWLLRLQSMLYSVPSAAVGEAGLDKGKRGQQIDIEIQMGILRQQLLLAKDLNRPVSVHCVRAFGELHELLKEIGPFPAGVILHSYLGSAEMVQPLAKFGAFFSFSGFLTSLSNRKAEKMLREVPLDRILLETDAPDAIPRIEQSCLYWVPGDPEAPATGHFNSDDPTKVRFPSQALNHPANIRTVLSYISSLLGISEEDLAEAAYKNAVHLFSFTGSKVTS